MISNECLQILFMLRIKCTAQEGVECSGIEGARGSTRCRITYVGCSSSQRSCQACVIARIEKLVSSEIKREPKMLLNPQQNGIAKESFLISLEERFQ